MRLLIVLSFMFVVFIIGTALSVAYALLLHSENMGFLGFFLLLVSLGCGVSAACAAGNLDKIREK